MKEFVNVILCDEKRDDLEIHVNASYVNEKLVFSGRDIGEMVSILFGKDSYEYLYLLSGKEAVKFLELIGGLEGPEEALIRAFSGFSGMSKLQEFCDENNIQYFMDSNMAA